jgi:hypothetical protein
MVYGEGERGEDVGVEMVRCIYSDDLCCVLVDRHELSFLVY